MSFIDDYSRFTTVVLLKNKSDAFETIQNYISAVDTQTGLTVQPFRNDNGGEYMNSFIPKSFLQKGIKHETSVPYSHESIGVAEHFNRSIQDLARTSGMNSGLPRSLWGEAIAMITNIKNLLAHSALTNQTPYQANYGVRPPFHIFGTLGKLPTFSAHQRHDKATKNKHYAPRKEKCAVLGNIKTSTLCTLLI